MPFLASVVLLAISVWMRVRLSESPAFAKLKEEGNVTKMPLREAFANRDNLRRVMIAFFGIMTAAVSQNRKYLMSGALIAVVAVSAYGLGRVYPPLGPAEGTIAPAERYVSSQVQSGDVTLGDQSVPQLMQTDAFELMTKDPSFAAMVKDPAFAVMIRLLRRPS